MDIDEVRKDVDLESHFKSRTKLADGVFSALRHLIVTQKIKGGERLDYKEIGLLLKVSRVPIREAVQRLEATGLLRVTNNLGTYVVSLSREDIEDIFEIRLMLERGSVAKAIDRIPHEKLRELKSVFAEEAGSENRDPEYHTTEAIMKADDELHNLIVDSADSQIFSRVYGQIENFILAVRYMNRREYVSSREHIDIIDALLAGEVETAQDRVEAHLRSVCSKLLDNKEEKQREGAREL